MRLKDRVALITGTASKIGIGYSIAMELSKEGAIVIVTDVSDTSDTADDILSAGGKADSIGMDVTDEVRVNEVVDEIYKRYGRIDILVNNAGICPFVPLLELTKDIWETTINVNLTGVFLCSMAVARQMVKNGHRGKIINISSMCVEHPAINQTPYAASKGGVYMLSKNMALELAPYYINVNSIAPAGMTTNIMKAGDDILDSLGRSDKKMSKAENTINMSEFRRRIPEEYLAIKEREILPYDIAHAALFLASNDSDHITGQTLYVNGFNFIC